MGSKKSSNVTINLKCQKCGSYDMDYYLSSHGRQDEFKLIDLHVEYNCRSCDNKVVQEYLTTSK